MKIFLHMHGAIASKYLTENEVHLYCLMQPKEQQ
jgi:hypothetical protein